MHFFIDHIQLPIQNTVDTFAPDSDDPTNKFGVTSRFQLTGQAKAFACQDSLMIVQQSSVDNSLVNVILKPIEGLKIPFNSVKYFVYRGLLKNSFVSGAAITPQETSNSEFIARFWTNWNNYKTISNQPNLTDPSPQSFGFDTSLSGSLNIESIYDNSQTDVRALLVKEGEWIGDFGTSFKIGFEIIMETDNPNFDLDFMRARKSQIDVTDLTGIELRAKREHILSFIDPAAFFGLHYDSGVRISSYNGNIKTTVKKNQDDIYSLLLNNKFATKNKVYLDIRSEKGFSYNFYRNYDNGSGVSIKIGNSITTPTEQVYDCCKWPIVIIDIPLTTTANKNDIKINLRVDDNIKPILFFENTDISNENNRSRFIDETRILNSTGWSQDLSFIFPNTGTGSVKDNVAYYIKLNYFRQEYNSSSPSTVLKNENDLDNIFGSLDMRFLGDSNYLFQHSVNSNLFFLKGQFPSLEKFSYVAESGAFYDNNRVAFYVQMGLPHKNSKRFYPQNTGSGTIEGLNLNGQFNKMSLLAKDIGITKFTIQEITASSTYQQIGILDIFAYNGLPSSEENIFILGVTNTELSALTGVTGLSNKHPRYIVFEDVSPTPPVDKDGKTFKKYKLKVQGLNSNGDSDIKTPSTDVFVYTTRGFIFSSKDFANAETLATTTTYSRNYEEKIGFDNIEKNSGKRYEDYFIDINSGMKTEVDGFINTLAITANDENAFQNIKTLVENSATDIWDEAVSFVQANTNANPDDRPLYWARNKMEVALKSHPYFAGQFDAYSIPAKNSDLEKMITIFEEKSRNYLGIDFSAYPTLKKVLIAGFDPFFLNPKTQHNNILQSNPSGCVALSLHNTLTDNGVGYIQAIIVPVRYTDFDGSTDSSKGQGEGIIEKYLKPWISEVDTIITISQTVPPFEYNIDKYATATRGGTIDNLGYTRQIPSFGRSINIIGEPELEWLETTLPSQFINPPVVLDQSYTDKNGVPSITFNALLIQTGVQIRKGSGGNYLSNEIFYRVSLLRNRWIKSQSPSGVTKATGHFHIKKLQNEEFGENFSITKTQELINIVRTAINNGITGL